jgi:hypothetical protein
LLAATSVISGDTAGRFGFGRTGRTQSMPEPGDTAMRRPEPHAAAARSSAAKLVRALIPRVTPGLTLRALLGVLLFFGGIVLGVWLIIRFRWLDRESGALDAPPLTPSTRSLQSPGPGAEPPG